METEMEQEVCDAKWNRTGIGVWGSERGSGTGNMKHVGEWNEERGYERISRTDRVGDNGPN